MKLSTKSTYGLRALLNIALGAKGRAVSIKDISRREKISVAYLEQLLNRLRRAGIIESIRGPKGGYRLSRDASKITVADVVKTLEGRIYPVHCVDPRKKGNVCRKSGGCVPKIVWLKLARAISGCLEAITLKELCAESKKMAGSS